MAAGRRGRPYQVPEDSTPVAGSTVDVDARVGWLLLMSRLHHHDPDLALGESFNAALRSVGLYADRSAVSRWESGKVPPRYSVLVAYEQALGLPTGQLTSVVNAQRRAYAINGPTAWVPTLDSTSPGFHERLDVLFDALLDGPGTGAEWTALAHHVSAAGFMYVSGGVWQQLTRKLVNQMARSVRLSYLQRFEAIRLLLEHRVAHPWLLAAIGEHLADPAVQVVHDPMGVLEISEAPQAADLALEMFLTTTSAEVLRAATEAVAIKVESHAYTVEQLVVIEQAVLSRLSQPAVDAAVFEELAVTMPDPARGRLLRATRGLSGHEHLALSATHGERVTAEVARRVSDRIADAVREELPASNLYDDDRMTPRLIREALFSARSNRRHYASLALVGSPFGRPLVSTLVVEIDKCGVNDPLVGQFARLVRYLASAEHEEALLGWLPQATAEVARDMALTLGHLKSDHPLDELLPLVRGDGSALDRGLIYALGMRQVSALGMLANDESRPQHVREAARWWLRQGGVVRD